MRAIPCDRLVGSSDNMIKRTLCAMLVATASANVWARDGIFACDERDENGSLDSQTFAIDPACKARLLGLSLMLVDTGDHDSDEHSELILAPSSYNRGGDALFSNDFVEQARFVFSYH